DTTSIGHPIHHWNNLISIFLATHDATETRGRSPTILVKTPKLTQSANGWLTLPCDCNSIRPLILCAKHRASTSSTLLLCGPGTPRKIVRLSSCPQDAFPKCTIETDLLPLRGRQRNRNMRIDICPS